jgi:hypothetical protein
MISYPGGYLARRGTDEAAEAEVAPARFFVWFACGGGGESAGGRRLAPVLCRRALASALCLPPLPPSLSFVYLHLQRPLACSVCWIPPAQQDKVGTGPYPLSSG